MSHSHAIVWIDHREARIFHVGLSGTDEVVMHSHLPTQHIHHKTHSIGSGNVQDDKHFFHQTADALQDAEQIIVIGPSTEKQAFQSYLHEHAPKLTDRIVAVESADHPTDRQIIAYARQYFKFGPVRA